MGIWITFFICGLGISISLRYLGKMLNSLIIFGFIAFAIVKLSTVSLGTWLLLLGTTAFAIITLSIVLSVANKGKYPYLSLLDSKFVMFNKAHNISAYEK